MSDCDALADLNLGTDPWNTNRYTFGGGNPISRVELDGHVNECLSCGGGGGDASVLAAVQSEPGSTGTTPEPVDTHGVAALDRDSPYDSPVEALQEKVRDRPRPSVTDTVHSMLDSCGLVPLVGEPCDAVNTGWYAAEGDFWNAALSGAALLPIGGQVATAAKLGKRTHDAAKGASASGIRFSQSSVNGAAGIEASMRANGWVGDSIDVVRMGDGGLTSLDNTRLLAAKRAGIDVQANIHGFDDALPSGLVGRFTTAKGGVPSTWGDAAMNRIGNQSAGYRNANPLGSWVTGWSGN